MGDILKFRKALEHMDGKFPFGEAYGPAWTRDESLESALSVYHRLLTLSPEGKHKSSGRRLSRIENLNGKPSPAISFDLLRLLATDEEGREIREKVMAYRRLFRPNLSNEILPVAFVQSCDSVYRRLRYFRASVGNAR
jgi:hypothetical protein